MSHGSLTIRPEQPPTSDAYDAQQDSGRAYGEHGNRAQAPVWDEELNRWRPSPQGSRSTAFGVLLSGASEATGEEASIGGMHLPEYGAELAAWATLIGAARQAVADQASIQGVRLSEDEAELAAWAATLGAIWVQAVALPGLTQLPPPSSFAQEGEGLEAAQAPIQGPADAAPPTVFPTSLPPAAPPAAPSSRQRPPSAPPRPSKPNPPPCSSPARTQRPPALPRGVAPGLEDEEARFLQRGNRRDTPQVRSSGRPPSQPFPSAQTPASRPGMAAGLEPEEIRFQRQTNGLDRRPRVPSARPASGPGSTSRPSSQMTTLARQLPPQAAQSASAQPRSAPPPPRGTAAGLEEAERRFLSLARAPGRRPQPQPVRPAASQATAIQATQPARPAAPPRRPSAPPAPRGTAAGIEDAEARFLSQAAAADRRPAPRRTPPVTPTSSASGPNHTSSSGGGWVSMGADVLRDEAAGIRRPPARSNQLDAWVARNLTTTDPGWFNSRINQEQATLRQALSGNSELGALTERESRYLLERATKAWEQNFGTGPEGRGVRIAVDFANSLANSGNERLSSAAADVMARRAASYDVIAEIGGAPTARGVAEAYALAAVETANGGGLAEYNARGLRTVLRGLTDDEAGRLGTLLAGVAEQSPFGPGRTSLAYMLAAAGGLDQSLAADSLLRGALGNLNSEPVASAVDLAVALEAGFRPRAAEAFARGAAQVAQAGRDPLRAGNFADAALRYAADGIDGGIARDPTGLRALFDRLSDTDLAGFLAACDQGVRLEALRDQLGESVLAAIAVLNGGELAAIGSGAAAPDARNMGIAAALAFSVPAETVASAAHPHAAETVGIALARLIEPPTDTAAVAGTAAHLASILDTAQGRELLLLSDALSGLPVEASTALRQQILSVLDVRRDIDARMLAQYASGFECVPLVERLAQPRADAFAALADQLRLAGPMHLDGPQLANLIGFTLGLPASGAPGDPTLLLTQGGNLDLYTAGPHAAQVARIADTIRFLGGDSAQVIPMAVQVASREFGILQATVFQVTDAAGQTWFVDASGERYRSLDAWRSANDLPPGVMTYAERGEQIRGNDGQVALTTEATPQTVDTFGERAVQVVDGVMLVGGVVATGALIIGTGGAAGLVLGGVAVASATWAGGRSAVNLHQRFLNGQELNPFVSAEARADWLNLASSVAGVGAMRAGLVASQAAQMGRATPTMLRAAGMWEATSNVLDAASMVDGGLAIAQAWDRMSVQDRMLSLLGPAFWAGGVTHNAGGLREVVSSPTRLVEQFTPSGVEAGLARHAPGLAVPDVGLNAPPGPRTGSPSLAEATPGRVIAADPEDVVLVRDGSGKPFAVGTRGQDGTVDASRLEPHDAAGVARALGLPEGSRVVVSDRQVVVLSPERNPAGSQGGWRAQTLSPDDPGAKPLVEVLAPLIQADTRTEQSAWRRMVDETFGVDIPAEPVGRPLRAPTTASPPAARPGEVITKLNETVVFVRDANGRITHFGEVGEDGKVVGPVGEGGAAPLRPAKGQDLRDLLGLPFAARVFADADGYTVCAPQRVRGADGEERIEVVAQVVRPSDGRLYELVALLAAEQNVPTPRFDPIAELRDGRGVNAELRLSLGAGEPINRETLVRGQTSVSLDTLDLLFRHLGEHEPKVSREVFEEAVGFSAKGFNIRDPDLFRKGLFTLPYGNATAIEFKLDALQRFALAAAGEEAAGATPSQPFRFRRSDGGTDEAGSAWVTGQLELNVTRFEPSSSDGPAPRDAFGNPLRPGVTYYRAAADIPLSKISYEDTFALLGFSITRKNEPTTKFTISKDSLLPAEFVDNINRTFDRLEVRLTEAVPSYVGELPAATAEGGQAPRWQRTAEQLFPAPDVAGWPAPFGPTRLPPQWIKVDVTPRNSLLDSGIISVNSKPGMRLNVEGRLPAETMGVSIRFTESDVMRTALRQVLGAFGLRPFLNERVPGVGPFSAQSFFETAIAGRGPRSLYDAIVGAALQGRQTTQEVQFSFAPLSLRVQVDAFAGVKSLMDSVLPSFASGDWARRAASLQNLVSATFGVKAPTGTEVSNALHTLWKPRLALGPLGDSFAKFSVFNLLGGEVSVVFTRAGLGSFRGSAGYVAPEAGPNAISLARVSAEGGRFLSDPAEAGVVIEVPSWLAQAGRNDFASVPRGGAASLEALLRERMALTSDPARKDAYQRFIANELPKLVRDGEALTTAQRAALVERLVTLGCTVSDVDDPLRLSPHGHRLASLAGAAGGQWTEAGIARLNDWLAMASAAPDAALRATARAVSEHLAANPPTPGRAIRDAEAAMVQRILAADRESFATGAWQLGLDPSAVPSSLHRLVAGGPLLWIHDVYDERRFTEGEVAGSFVAFGRPAPSRPVSSSPAPSQSPAASGSASGPAGALAPHSATGSAQAGFGSEPEAWRPPSATRTPPQPPADNEQADQKGIARETTATVHVVVAGDTLLAIARRFGVTLSELLAANPQIANPDLIHPGDVIRLPQGTVEMAPSTAG